MEAQLRRLGDYLVGATRRLRLSVNFEKRLLAGSSKMDQKCNMTDIALLRLNRIDRYEQRAAWRRDKALRAIGLVERTHKKALEGDA